MIISNFDCTTGTIHSLGKESNLLQLKADSGLPELGSSEEVFLPHLILGIAEIGASLMNKQHPSYPEAS